jgi:hypothetical protein
MADTENPLGLCCYKNRALVSNRCGSCMPEYGCPEFKTKAALVQFNAMIPPSMLLAPLPIELWPKMSVGVSADTSSNESPESPIRRFVSTLGLPLDADPNPNST